MLMSNETESQYAVWRDYYFGIQGLFYFAQGIAMGALIFITSFLSSLGLNELERIIIQAVIWIPWFLKVVFGILSDNVSIGKYGRRKPYIFAAGLFGIIGWVTLPMHAVYGPLLILSGIFASLGTGMSDATIDALAVDITPPNKRGRMQGVSWGSRGIGFGISGLLVGSLADAGEWFIVFGVPGIMVSLSVFLVLLFKENPLPDDFKRVALGVYASVIKRREVLVCMLFQLLSGAAIAILVVMQTYLESPTGAGFLNATIGFILFVFAIGMFIGSVLFGALGDRITVRMTLPFTTAFYSILIFSILFLSMTDITVMTVLFFFVGIANGGYEATQMRIGMDNSPSIVAGTMYNLYNSLSNIGQLAIGAIAIGLLVDVLGDFRLGWQIGIFFLILALIPGFALAKWGPTEGRAEDGQIVIIDGEL